MVEEGKVFRGRRVVTPTGVGPADVLVRGGRIVRVGAYGSEGAGEVEDVGERVLFPGLVDCHVHINEPGRTAWEGFATATAAAAAGGITTVVDMPLNSDPVTTTRDAFRRKLDATGDQLRVDVGFWGGVIPGNTAELGPMVDAGILGFKCFLCPSGIDDFPPADAPLLRQAMPRLRERGVPLLVHAELEHPVDPAILSAGAASPDWRRYLTYLRSRPRTWEDEAIRMMVELCRETGCRTHIVHLSSADALPDVRRAREEGLPFTAETCPHYLTLDAEEVPDGATVYKCAPPIRERENRDRLWGGLLDGTVELVISDHSPCVPALKRLDTGDFEAAWGGIASLQLGLPTIWTEARRRGATLSHLAEWMCLRPARLAGLEGRKGAIAPGYDADLVAWDPEVELVIQVEDLMFKNKLSPYLGRRFLGRVEATWLRGQSVFQRGRGLGPRVGRRLGRGDQEVIDTW